MKDYSNNILQAFSRIRYLPRDNQVSDINLIVNAFIDEKFDNVVLSAPTGLGKSIIGAVVAEVCAGISHTDKKASIILMHNNILVNQYHGSFSDHEGFSNLKGVNNYTCAKLPSLPNQESSAADCVKDFVGENPTCNACEFNISRKQKNLVNHLITNYDYYFAVSQLADIEILNPRYMTVWDEAHTINEVFSNHNTIYLNEEKIDHMIEDAIKLNLSDDIVATLNMSKKLLSKNKITHDNYKRYIESIIKLAIPIQMESLRFAEDFWDDGDRDNYVKFNRIHNKYKSLNGLLNDFIDYQFEHVFQALDKEIYIKPIFIGRHIFQNILGTSVKNLFMSATVTKEFLVKTVGLDPEKTKEIKLDPIFSKENKKFVFAKPISLNNRTINEPKTTEYLAKICKMIVGFHENESGIILTPSFLLANQIAEVLKKDHNIIEHVRSQSLTECVERFKETKGSILISPSLFEGLNLEDDICRFQILVKAPYPSLADDRMKYIMDNYPDIFSLMTLMKIVQGAGRAIRNINDHAVTYALDSNIERLFKSKENIWKDEFEVIEFK
jgi:Rad3-related DNA helicase